jgi:hypothetical protein
VDGLGEATSGEDTSGEDTSGDDSANGLVHDAEPAHTAVVLHTEIFRSRGSDIVIAAWFL